MSAPMGTFKVSTGEPRAVRTLDRSLRESAEPGEYETVITLPEPGAYDLVFLMNTPTVVHCFPFEVVADPALARARAEGKVNFQWLGSERGIQLGASLPVKFMLTDALGGLPKADIGQVDVDVILSPGIWRERVRATHQGGGLFLATFTPTRSGMYH